MKTLFITGGHGEIGSAIASAFTKKGYSIIAPTSKELDCSNAESISAFFKDFSNTGVTALVHCAGINNPKPFTESSAATLSMTMEINTFSLVHIIKHLNSLFTDGESRIVAISSIYGSISRTRRLEYSTSKHALKGLIQTLALELAPRNILINAVSPGFIATKLTYKNNSSETIEKLVRQVPLKKLGKPEYIAEAVHFLCSESNQFITGQDLIVDGGYLAGGFEP